jgi:hypothetical protein
VIGWRRIRWRLINLWMRLTTNRAYRQEFLWLAADLANGRVNAPLAPEGLRFREIPVRDLEGDPSRFGLTPTELQAPVPRRFYAGFIGDEWVYRMWTFILTRDDQVIVPVSARAALREPAVVAEGCFTRPEYRGNSIYAAALAWLADKAHSEGNRQLVLQVRRGNVASLRAVSKAGFRTLGS